MSGVKETPGENTGALILKICADNGVPVQLSDIDRSHRVGKPPSPPTPLTPLDTKPRAIIVKFATYRVRSAVFKSRTNLKSAGYEGVFLNEDLTKPRNTLLYHARQLAKDKKIDSAWSSDGTILIKNNLDNIVRINHTGQLKKYY